MAKKPTSDKTVTRIKAADTSKARSEAPAAKSTKLKDSQTAETPRRRGPFMAVVDYFKGSWYELGQVRWPTRRATWGLTLAVIGFSAFYVILILLLDIGFQFIFDQLLK